MSLLLRSYIAKGVTGAERIEKGTGVTSKAFIMGL